MPSDESLPSPADDSNGLGVPDPSGPIHPSGTSDDGRPDDALVDADRIAAAQRKMRLLDLVREIEKHVADEGWDQNPRLFALARTCELVILEPALAEALGAAAQDPGSMTPIEQEPLDDERALDEVLATTMWPDEVAGVAIVLERLVLPPSVESQLPDEDRGVLESTAATHPERQDVRMAVVVTRDGGRMCAVRMRSHDVDDEVLVGPDIVPRLADALAATLI